MSKKKNNMTPAQVADELGRYMAKQEETLAKYPVGPLGNAARRNLERGRAAIEALKGQNESMRQKMPGQAPSEMKLGGDTLAAALEQLTPAQRAMYDSYIEATGAVPEAALAVVSVSDKESSGDHTKTETDYSKTSNDRIRKIFSRTSDMSDEELTKLKKDPEAFFNKVYDGRIGNGEGEGYKYRGRGMIQLTGKENYRKASQAIYGDDRLVDTPDLILEDPKIAGQVATWFMTKGDGVGTVAGVDVTDPNITPEQLGAIADSSYAVVAGTNNLAKAQERTLFAEGTARQHEFLGKLNIESIPTTQSNYQVGNAGSVEATQAEAERRESETLSAEQQETLAFLQGQVGEGNVPDEARMTYGAAGDGTYRGYLGGTYGADATRVDMNVPDPELLRQAAELNQMQATRDEQSTPEEQQKEDARIGVDVLSPDFSYDEILAWGKDTYGVSEGRKGGGDFTNTDNMIIGANTYSEDRGHLMYEGDALAKLGGAGITVDETRVLAQALVNNGLSKDQALEALSDPATYREMKSNIPQASGAGKFGKHTLEMAQEAAEAADEWARTTENREALAGVVDRGEEGGENYFATELAPGINPEISQRDAAIARDRQAFLRKNPGRMYTPGAGGTMTAAQINPNSTLTRQISTAQAAAENPNDFREEPTFMDTPVPETKETVLDEKTDMIPAPEPKPEPTPDPQPEKNNEAPTPEPTPEKTENTPALPTKQIEVDAAPEMAQIDMPKVSYLQAIPAMASLASAGIQRRALNQMTGPAAPIQSDIPAFSYQSNINQSLADVRNATNAAGNVDGLSPQARAAYRQNLMNQRYRQEAGLRAQDNQQKQAAQARYDAMAMQARMAQDQVRNKYLDDRNAFNNQKAMLDAQIKQQPLNVLSASTQDYLKNVYAPGLAAQIEGLGRQFDTGAYNTSVFDQDAE